MATTNNILPITPQHFLGFWDQVEVGNGCWTWKKSLQHGYGQWRGRRAHRVAFAAVFGEIPNGMVIDHMCGNTKCVNPYHLDAVTSRINTIRSGKTLARQNAMKTVCPRGHAMSGENVRIYKGSRYCRQCEFIRSRRRRGL